MPELSDDQSLMSRFVGAVPTVAKQSSRDLHGALLKAVGVADFELTVTGRREISPHYLRLGFHGGGLLSGRSIHPTMWVRMWFPDESRLHMRAFTLVEPDAGGDRFDIEFALHEGRASNWARNARVGDTIMATIRGSRFAIPQPPPAGYLVVGDTASLPAINSLLAAIGDAPATVWLEWQHEDDRDLPVAATARTEVTWVPREHGGAALVHQVRAAAFAAPGHFGWVACDRWTTRKVASVLRNDFHLARNSLAARGYW
ncbi:Iron import ATP-binding/permease protein IrtA [Nocardia brasiliensis]|nr:Iron import ATP-binding/permease protein IrtA [Nocardia brasiliensis]